MAGNNTEKSKRRASNVLTAFNILFLMASIAIIIKVAVTQYIWEPDPRYISYFHPKKARLELEPERGAIIDHNGRLLAKSTPLYDIYMDCHIQKEAFKKYKDREKGEKAENDWKKDAAELAERLPGVLKEKGRTEQEYKELILGARDKAKGTKGVSYVPIAKNIDHGTLLELKKLPLFNEKVSYRNGMIVEKKETRQYPYDGLARRVIGYVRNNQDESYHIGIEGKYDYILSGKKGEEWKKITDRRIMIKDVDSSVVAAEDGLDIRTTLDISIQDIADRALRENMAKEENIVGGCVVILDVETAAVRAMVNLRKNDGGQFRERFNMAAGTSSEPGSVFKAVTLTTLLEDECVSLDTEIPSNHGIMHDMAGQIVPDGYVVDYERETGKDRISVQEGFKRSSNYVFRRLVKDHYGDRPDEFINRLHEYNFGEAYQFDLTEAGSAKPMIPDPQNKRWTMSDLVSVAIGYSVRVTPLQVVTFYNAIANKGKMMKPYVVESLESDGRTVKEYKPVILNGSICSEATADTLTKALTVVTERGTAKRLRNAKTTIAGKTGTARIHLEPEENPKPGRPYESMDGKKKHQATFVGFFPAEAPKYTAIVVVYTGLIKGNVYGGNIPAATFKDIADELWAYDEEWGQELRPRGEVPEMKAAYISTDKSKEAPVPDLKGLGLRDAVYAIENNGYRCSHTGTGHVVSQNPEAGTKTRKGQTINIVLR